MTSSRCEAEIRKSRYVSIIYLSIYLNLCRRETAVAADVGAQARQAAPIFKFFGKKFHAVQIDGSIADFSANSNRVVSTWIFEFDLNLAAYRKIGCRKQANAAFA